MIYLIIAIVIVSVILAFILSLFNESSPNLIWTLVNFYQMLLLIPLIGAFVHKDVVDFTKGLDFSSLSFEFINSRSWSMLHNIYNFFEWKEANSYLNDIELKDWSTMLNILTSNIIDVCLILIHLWFALIYLWCRTYQNWFQRFVLKIFYIFTFSIYIRKILESYLLFSISSIKEIYSLNSNSKSKTISLSFAIAIEILLLCVPAVIFWLHFHELKPQITSKHKVLNELFEGFKAKRCSKLYFFVFTARRQTLIWWIFCSSNYSKIVRIWVYFILQLFSLPYMIIVRPYSCLKESICEILNEFVYSSLWIFLIFVNSETDWTKTLALIVVGVLVFNSIIILTILIIWISTLIIKLWLKYRSDKSKINIKEISNKSKLNISHNLTNNSNLNKNSMVSSLNLQKKNEENTSDYNPKIENVMLKRKIYLRD